MQLLFVDNLLRALSWSFIHSLWQGLLLTILAGLVILLTRRSAAALRYGLLCSLFFLFLGGVLLSFLIEWNTGGENAPGLDLINHATGIEPVFHHSLLQQLLSETTLFLDSNAAGIILGWGVIFGWKLARMLIDMVYVYRLRQQQVFMPHERWKIRLQSLSREMGIRRKISLLESGLTRTPLVIGYFKPVILVPLGILTHLSPAEIEAVLLHELAHIRRHDYLINFIQRITELLFFFNPGFLWVSSLLRVERENCCDDIAIDKTKNKLLLLEALLSFKEHSLKQQGPALAFFGKKHLLFQRVTRIVYNRNKSLSPVETGFFFVSLIAFVILLASGNKPAVSSQFGCLPFLRHARLESVSFTRPGQQTQTGSENHSIAPLFANGRKTRINTLISQEKSADPENKRPVINEIQLNEKPEQFAVSREQTRLAVIQAAIDRQQADKDRRQADKDRALAEQSREQAEKDRQQADKDRQQAERDREQAERDRKIAEIDRQRAARDREQAIKDRQQVEKTG